jgi:hypothetical protein
MTGVTFSAGWSEPSSRGRHPPAKRRVAREEQADVDRPVVQRLNREGPGVERDELLEVQAVDILQPFRHNGRSGHSGGPPNVSPGAYERRSLSERTCNPSATVAGMANAFVSSAGAALNAVRPRGASANARRSWVVAGSLEAVPPKKPSRLPAYSGTSSTSPRCKAGISSSRGPTSNRRSTWTPRPRGPARDLGQHLALGEVERSDRDGVVVQDARDRRALSRPQPIKAKGRHSRTAVATRARTRRIGQP